MTHGRLFHRSDAHLNGLQQESSMIKPILLEILRVRDVRRSKTFERRPRPLEVQIVKAVAPGSIGIGATALLEDDKPTMAFRGSRFLLGKRDPGVFLCLGVCVLLSCCAEVFNCLVRQAALQLLLFITPSTVYI